MRKFTIFFTIAYLFSIPTSTITVDQSNSSPTSFSKHIRKKAQEWVDLCITPMNHELKQLMCNMLCITCTILDSNISITKACAVHIADIQESDKDIRKSSEQLQHDIQYLLSSYIASTEKKLKRYAEKNIDQKAFAQALEEKIHELIFSISLIYYEAIHSHMRSNNLGQYLTYMFNEDGIIPEDKRTNPLPEPAIVQEQFKQLMRSLKTDS